MGENDCFGKHIEMYAFLKLMSEIECLIAGFIA
jgi:hypothetical protein